MIWLTRLSHDAVVLNSDLIEYIDTTPDTVITLTSGQKLVVLEPAQEIIDRVVEFRRAAGGGTHHPAANRAQADGMPAGAGVESHGS
jgi:flagellar protein FlbD